MVDIVGKADEFIAAVGHNADGARTTDSIARELAKAMRDILELYRPATATSRQKLAGRAGLDELISSIHFILFARALTLEEGLYTREANRLMARLEAHLAQHGAATQPSRPDVLDYRTLDPRAFYEEYVVGSRIAVIKNFDCEAWTEWSVKWFIDRFGDEKFPLLRLGKNDDPDELPDFTEQAPLRLLFDERDKYFFANSQELFDRHPDLGESLNLSEIARCLEPGPGRAPLTQQSQQFFVSTGPAATSAIHHGKNANFFFNVQGTKRWTLTHPEFSFMMCAWIRPFDAVCAFKFLDEFSKSWVPTLRYLPHYQVNIEPGDILYNPYYWWHTVESLSSENLGVSTRWVGPSLGAFQDPFPLATLTSMCQPTFRAAMAEAKRDAQAGKATNFFDQFAHGRSIEFGIANGVKPWGLTRGTPPARQS
mgnify:CR=1 FL=1